MSNQPSSPVGKLLGLIIMACAVLWLALCGMCAFGVLATVFTEAGLTTEAIPSLLFVLAIAGLGAAAGYGVFTVGRNLWRV
jgi:hypothetical protein